MTLKRVAIISCGWEEREGGRKALVFYKLIRGEDHVKTVCIMTSVVYCFIMTHACLRVVQRLIVLFWLTHPALLVLIGQSLVDMGMCYWC